MPIDSQRIRENGWRQGRLFSSADTAQILEKDESTAQLILISHDCDIVHAGESEPYVEVCLAERVDGNPNGLYRWARNPRRLELRADLDEEEVGLRIEAQTRKTIDRGVLEQFRPDEHTSLSEKECLNLVTWLAKRYARAALPDTFNNRVRPAQDRVRRVLRRDGSVISSLMVAISPKGEVADAEPYEVHVVGLMTKEDHDDENKRGRAETAVNQISEALDGCDDIDVVDTDVMSETTFTVDNLRHFLELSFDDLSLRADPPDPMLPNI